ncbi:MAG: HAMP domain-containing histidine kinase [Treponema sp.]|jgi:signal transduction histidine kinase|nr:HAMP domain-containing histidine kinase [Treponema sp.]
MISLRNRLALSYALFVCVSVLIMGAVIHRFAGKLFSTFVKEKIHTESAEIAHTIADLYDQNTRSFDLISVEAMGMHFVHQGYIVSVTDLGGNTIWDARSCDMEQCSRVIDEIAFRMENEFGVGGSLQTNQFLLSRQGALVGRLSIETFGPFFYNESESAFFAGLNRFFLVSGGIFIALSVFLSFFLAAQISRPVLKATEAARRIAGGAFSARVSGRYRTRELSELSRSVNDLAAALENGERWQKQLTADIAHELRTPLTCLQGNVEALIDGVWEPTAERLSSAYEEIVRLNKLVEDLNLLSILEQRNLILHKTEFDLAKLVGAAAERFSPAAREKGLAITVAESGAVMVNGDYDRLTQVFTNLIANAVQYTVQGGIAVSIAAAQGFCEVAVADTGIGLEEDELDRVFERFYRSDKSRFRSGTDAGAGIGLSIAQTIAAAHGGRIRAGLRSGGGSVFTVRLPRDG